MKISKLYEVRVFAPGSAFSRNLNRKCRIIPFRKAQAVARRLRRRGIDAVVGSPWSVKVCKKVSP